MLLAEPGHGVPVCVDGGPLCPGLPAQAAGADAGQGASQPDSHGQAKGLQSAASPAGAADCAHRPAVTMGVCVGFSLLSRHLSTLAEPSTPVYGII